MCLLFHRLRLWDYASSQRVDHIIANSQAVQRRIKRWWRRESTVIHPPVDISSFATPDISQLEKVLGHPDPGSYYLCLGQLVSYKWVDLAVQTCIATERNLIVAGDGPERKKLEKMAGPSVRFLRRVPNEAIPALYAVCRAFLFPGEENFGITPLEVSAADRPVIDYGKGGVLDSIISDKTGLFFEQQNIDSLIAAFDDFETAEDTVGIWTG
ncbi:glycosyltransferase [Bilophila wadsworthia]|jgi:glycosyltransferase involved in cell wall biosynthesis|uniref:glycosyltransferase n=1 Tax=Bilophila wadsworthia TaxID=35833 RepID=UPI00266B3C5A|nr:glycosyltransferase [Bilophila wadsworthia]